MNEPSTIAHGPSPCNPASRWLLLLMLAAAAGRAENGWTSETTRDGKVRVQSRISFAKAANGSEKPVVEYKASTIARVGFAQCLAVLQDVSKHKRIHDDHSSETVSIVSDTERIVHYGLKVVWPLPKVDCVARMVVQVDSIARTATITLSGAPTLLEPRAERRLADYRQTYILADRGDGSVELRSIGRSSPPFSVPEWMLKAAFPAAAAAPLLRIVELAR